MGLSMTEDEREEFLAGVHVGILAVERPSGPPLAVPVWYDYRPGGELWIITPEDSVKGRLLQAAGRFSLCAQDETPPFYRYVSVEGPVVSILAADEEDDARPLAHRYLGPDIGDQYVESADEQGLKFCMRPERWWSVDYSKVVAGG
jgi:nitroimidazol reductase NimA-like FMN-containing flavoprotein (pyridoxamine 5'-phosphate oxidase superfamily)